MDSARARLGAALVAVAASAAVLCQAPAALANDHGGDLPVMVASPTPGQIDKEHKVTDTYQFGPKGGSSSDTFSHTQPLP